MTALETTDSERLIEQPALRSKARGWPLREAYLSVTVALMVINLYLIFMWAPTDAILGHVQRIFYFHVPIAWVAFLAFFIVFVSSIRYLWTRNPRWDALAHSAAEIGVLFATLVLVTGVIWAKPVWGVWWTWDPRLTTSLILWLIYVAYLMLRAYAPNRSQGAVYAAVVGVVGFIDVPIVYFAVEWWRAVHPESVVGPLAETGSLDSSMRAVLMFSLLTFTFLFVFLLWERLSLRNVEDTLRSARQPLMGLRHH
jgi:heme exporter protein C